MDEGRRWRRSRDLEVLAMTVYLLRAMITDKPGLSELASYFPGYVAEDEE